MYLPFVMYGYAATLALVLVGCWLIRQVIPGLRGVRTLSAAIAATMLAVVLIGLRLWVPAFFTILLGNGALIFAFILIYLATARVLGDKPRFLSGLIALFLLDLPPYCYTTWIHPSLLARIWLSNGVVAIIATATGILLFRHRPSSLSLRAIGALQMGTAGINLARCVVNTVHPPMDFVHSDWIRTALTYGEFIFFLGTVCGILWLALCRNREELEQAARTDSLTGLLNRRAFDEILVREFERARFAGERLGIILLDLDRFKSINDTYGHAAGDEVLRRISGLLQQGTRPSDVLARYGGEEFVLLLRGAQLEEVRTIAERLRRSIEESLAGPSALQITTSLGMAIAEPEESAEDLIDRCDQALYASKRAGRNQVTEGATHETLDSAPPLQAEPH